MKEVVLFSYASAIQTLLLYIHVHKVYDIFLILKTQAKCETYVPLASSEASQISLRAFWNQNQKLK